MSDIEVVATKNIQSSIVFFLWEIIFCGYFSMFRKTNFLISQPKHMLWVLKRTVSMRRYVKTDG